MIISVLLEGLQWFILANQASVILRVPLNEMVDAAFLDPRSHLRRSSEFSFAILARHNGNLLAATRVILERRKGHERTTAFTHKSLEYFLVRLPVANAVRSSNEFVATQEAGCHVAFGYQMRHELVCLHLEVAKSAELKVVAILFRVVHWICMGSVYMFQKDLRRF